MVDGPPAPRRPPELPGRMSVPGKLCSLQLLITLSLQNGNFKRTFLTLHMVGHLPVALFLDIRPAVASLISSEPRTSSPSTAMDGVVS